MRLKVCHDVVKFLNWDVIGGVFSQFCVGRHHGSPWKNPKIGIRNKKQIWMFNFSIFQFFNLTFYSFQTQNPSPSPCRLLRSQWFLCLRAICGLFQCDSWCLPIQYWLQICHFYHANLKRIWSPLCCVKYLCRHSPTADMSNVLSRLADTSEQVLDSSLACLPQQC